MLSITNLHKIYPGGVHALKGVDLEVKKGVFYVVIGLSGSGKSTLLRCINRIHQPTEGRIIYKGEDITHLKGKAIRQVRSRMGMIFQHFNLVPRRSVMTNVLTGALSRTRTIRSLMGQFSSEDRDKAMENIRIMGLEGKEKHRIEQLSGGQKQRVSIARALMQNPELLLADEPVASLDPATSTSVMTYLEKVNKELGVTVMCNLHFLSLVRQFGTEVMALKDGRGVFHGSPDQIDEAWFKKIYGEDAVEVTIK
ncbi:MAG: phosphonate ABC transporter ATP-binding protein [Acidobacteria bacterium]|nr:MAG: phosphonate ABC transporter ATP-binding protein [Acidobacteriota bacterium]